MNALAIHVAHCRTPRFGRSSRLRFGAAIVLVLLAGCINHETVVVETETAPPSAIVATGQFTGADGVARALDPEQLQQLRYSGQGSYRWPDGHFYQGGWRNSQPDGQGQWRNPTGERYEGHWEHGQRNGSGILITSNGDRYEGSFTAGKRHGTGQQTSADGVYKGQWQNDQPQGHGTFEGADGSVYQGAYQNGNRHGSGHFTSAAGTVYEGDWLADEPSGFGVLIDADGGRREGQWLTGASNGYGTYAHPAGLSYSGEWSADQRAGFGAETRPDESRYEGDWVADKPNGTGTLTHSDGRIQTGMWRSGKAHGASVLKHPAGYSLEGQWQDGIPVSGTLTLANVKVNGTFTSTHMVTSNNAWETDLHTWLQNHAEANNPTAAWLLIERSGANRGPSVARNLMLAAQANIALAQYELGKRLLDEDLRSAIDWLNKASNGTPHCGGAAQFLLGSLYHFGDLIPQDQDQAESHYLSAIERGSVAARRNLAAMLATTSIDYLRDPERALAILEPIAQLYQSPGLLDALAVVYEANGRTADAIQTQESALQALAREAAAANPANDTLHAQIKATMEQRLAQYRTAAETKP